MTRSTALLALVTLVAAATFVAPPAAGQANNVTVSNVTVTPEQPNPGETFTVRTTVANAQSASNAFTITDVYVRRVGGAQDVTRIENVGSVAPGGQITVPLTMSLDEVGSKSLRVFVVGRSGGESVQFRYPFLVTVRRGGPQISVESGDGVVGTKSTVRVTTVNGEDQPIRNVRLSLSGENATVRNDSRVAATLPPGESQRFSFAVTPSAREAVLRANLTYTTAAGTTRMVRDTATLRADPLVEDVAVSAEVLGEGTAPPVAVDVSNFGNAPLTEVAVRLGANDTTLARQPVAAIPPGESRRVRFNLSRPSSGTFAVRAGYETGDRSGTAETTVEYATNPGRIELTGVDYETEGDRVHITGSVSNVGLSGVDAAVVSVVSREGVRPARPYREYFVGRVPASDFVSFDLYADVDANASSVPVRISYIVDGERRSVVRELDVSDLRRSNPEPASGGGSTSPLLLVAGAVAALVVVGVAAYAYVRR